VTVDYRSDDRLRKSEWYVADAPLSAAQEMVAAHHYTRGGSRSAVYVHGLYRKDTGQMAGVAWWLPPTRVACESVNREQWTKVLALTRLVVVPDVPKNACSFLMARSIAEIRRDGRFVSLVTYADERQGHSGGIYKATNWQYAGLTRSRYGWVDSTGRQVAQKSTVNRTNAQMEALGYAKTASFPKHKFVIHLASK
jgi:hypothetical protein